MFSPSSSEHETAADVQEFLQENRDPRGAEGARGEVVRQICSHPAAEGICVGPRLRF